MRHGDWVLTSIQAHVCHFDSYHRLINNSAGLRVCAEMLATRYVVDGRVIPQPINPRFKLASTDCKREQDHTLSDMDYVLSKVSINPPQ